VVEFRVALAYLFQGEPPERSRLRLRFSVLRGHMPIDTLPPQGALELHIISDAELRAAAC
jgi:hypothetical protein